MEWTAKIDEFGGDAMPHAILSAEGFYIGQATDPNVARIFAAGEAMLQALKVALDYIDQRNGDNPRPNPVRELMALAIAKAEPQA